MFEARNGDTLRYQKHRILAKKEKIIGFIKLGLVTQVILKMIFLLQILFFLQMNHLKVLEMA